MRQGQTPASAWLATIVVAHLLVSLVHGAAHAQSRVFLSTAGNVYLWVVIMAGPLVGLAVQRAWAGTIGAWVIAVSMAGALVFGLVNHFIIESGDHVSHVIGPWRTTFAVTAALLALTEAAGCGVGVWSALRGRRMSS
jgi:hypothetical protein